MICLRVPLAGIFPTPRPCPSGDIINNIPDVIPKGMALSFFVVAFFMSSFRCKEHCYSGGIWCCRSRNDSRSGMYGEAWERHAGNRSGAWGTSGASASEAMRQQVLAHMNNIIKSEVQKYASAVAKGDVSQIEGAL